MRAKLLNDPGAMFERITLGVVSTPGDNITVDLSEQEGIVAITLAERRAVETHEQQGDLSLDQIKEWVEVYRIRNERNFPTRESGEIVDASGNPTGEYWSRIDSLLKLSDGHRPSRGLQGCGHTSLSNFLDNNYPAERKVRTIKSNLSPEQIEGWVDIYRASHDEKFPSVDSGDVIGADGQPTGETWSRIINLFVSAKEGYRARGLQGMNLGTFAEFLDRRYPEQREPRISKGELSEAQIKEWVEVFRDRNGGEFPSKTSGEILAADGTPTGERWGSLDALFYSAKSGAPARGLKGKGYESLKDFLDRNYPHEREVSAEKVDITVAQVKEWVDVYRSEHGNEFPQQRSGPIYNSDRSPTGETWQGLSNLFRASMLKNQPARGLRGCGCSSLSDFLDKHYPNERDTKTAKADLSIPQLKSWVDAYRERNKGKFPSSKEGAIIDHSGKETGETWKGVDALFRQSERVGSYGRGLQGCGYKSLPDFFDKTYPADRVDLKRLYQELVSQWGSPADASSWANSEGISAEQLTGFVWLNQTAMKPVEEGGDWQKSKPPSRCNSRALWQSKRF